jgi:hypothetical protein
MDFLRSLSLGFTLLISGTSGSALAEEQWTVITQHVQCVLENINSYKESGQEVLMIVLSACPEPDINKALASLTQNSAVPGIGISGSIAAETIDNVIVYTPAELECLRVAGIDLTSTIARIPKRPHCT